jgi:oligoribonuclease
MKKENNLIWIDTELTGLDWSKNKIVEIAVVVTDENLNLLDNGLELVIHWDEETLQNMDPWCVENFAKSGLTEKIRQSKISLAEA